MSSYRLAINREFFLRDLLRDYCAVYLAVAGQLRRYRRDGSVSYPVITALIGESMGKGVFWRLKDTAHTLFRSGADDVWGEEAKRLARIGQYIDWCVGYAFHECCKLREDAFQGQHYATRLMQLDEGAPELKDELFEPLKPLTAQTAESSKRELNRILRVLRSGMQFLTRYLVSASENCSLARWLVTDEASARAAFGPFYKNLLKALYGNAPGRVYTLAATDFLECGRIDEAVALLRGARDRGVLDADGLAMLHTSELAAAEIGSEGVR